MAGKVKALTNVSRIGRIAVILTILVGRLVVFEMKPIDNDF
jgi:hypothetical protein